MTRYFVGTLLLSVTSIHFNYNREWGQLVKLNLCLVQMLAVMIDSGHKFLFNT